MIVGSFQLKQVCLYLRHTPISTHFLKEPSIYSMETCLCRQTLKIKDLFQKWMSYYKNALKKAHTK